MNFSFIKRQLKLVLLVATLLLITLVSAFYNGEFKPADAIDWLDVLGEGGMTLMTGVWIFFILASRPQGRVTNLLTLGLTCFLISCSLDLLDEFITYPDEHFWLYLLESIPALIGMVMMTWALYQWHQEQLKLTEQLNRREALIREHTQIDITTQLYSADYMREQLDLIAQSQQDCTLAMFDIDDFAKFNRQFSLADGDRLLREVADIIVMNLRQSDLACRYAGDRFIVLFNQISLLNAQLIVEQICTAIQHLAFKPNQTGTAEFHTVSAGLIESKKRDSAADLIRRVNLDLENKRAIRVN
ncbi:hypothetical protein XM47_06090 [Catenovulum maritimum]|uniref:diguanylate cyclase n=2 Tax=Catenovulum maritimum TaxID=1513271 RepID=A0A0J8GTL5_9ALTE|nr:hypothetical protein XM47_06090 [Catenovulum maritimum]